MVEMGGFEPPFAACAPVSLTHGCSCRELQNAITTLPHLHGGVLVFPSRQIFSVPRFCQQITGAITTSRLEGLTSGLRITQTAIPLKRSSLAVSTLNWHRRLDLNHRMKESKPLALPLGYVCVVPLLELPARCRVRCSELTGTAPAYGVEIIYTSEGDPKSLLSLWQKDHTSPCKHLSETFLKKFFRC